VVANEPIKFNLKGNQMQESRRAPKTKIKLTDEEIDGYQVKFRALSNNAKYAEAYRLAKRLMQKHPDVLLFAYYEALMPAEETTGLSQLEINRRYKLASFKLSKLLRRLRGAELRQRASIRNEYYWFSRQPYKQYLLGREMVKRGLKKFYYSQGVGAIEMAKHFALKNNKKQFVTWAKRSEKAWLKFFKEDSKWYNSYFFYAMTLGYQGRQAEMDKALTKAAKIAGKSIRWKAIKELRREIEYIFRLFES
jgi:hypothetical protein